MDELGMHFSFIWIKFQLLCKSKGQESTQLYC